MEQKAEYQPATQESVWAAFRETDRLLKEYAVDFDRRMKKQEKKREAAAAAFDLQLQREREEREKERKEREKERKEREREREAAAAAFDLQLQKEREEREKERKEREKEREEREKERKAAAAAFDLQLQKDREKREATEAAFNKRMKKIDETLGAWANNQGAFAEDYFFNSFENGKRNFFGEPFDRIEKNLKPLDYVIKDEYDLVMVNGKSVAIIEVKYKAHEHNIPQVIGKVDTFRANYPNYARHKIFLGLASLSLYPLVEQECTKNGIAVIKQVGDAVVINDAHLRAY